MTGILREVPLLTSTQLRKRQAAMLAKRGVRPWDHVHDERGELCVLRLRKMFAMGMSDDFIGNALDLDAGTVSLLRSARHRGLRRRREDLSS